MARISIALLIIVMISTNINADNDQNNPERRVMVIQSFTQPLLIQTQLEQAELTTTGTPEESSPRTRANAFATPNAEEDEE